MTTQILLSGFGGQGILFTGKFLAYKGLLADKNVSWLPSYGPEMRGGTASCSVIISDEEVGSPIISQPDVLIAMKDFFLRYIKKGGTLIISGIIEERMEEVLTAVESVGFIRKQVSVKEGWAAAEYTI